MVDKDDTEKEWTNKLCCTCPEEHAGADQRQKHATAKRSRQRCQSASHGAQRVIVDSERRVVAVGRIWRKRELLRPSGAASLIA